MNQESLTRISSRADLVDFMAADLKANGLTRWRPWTRYRKPTMVFLRALRRAEYYSLPTKNPFRRIRGVIARIYLTRVSLRTGISILPGCFGKGLCLPHYGSIVVNSHSSFGDYCCIQSSVNIGVSDGGVPRGGSFVYIAPGAVIYGGIEIGSRAVIGANAVVGRSVPDGTTWAGAPARQISESDSYSSMPAGIRSIMDGVAPIELPGSTLP